eukprot:jgi/Picre1/33654/NNA_001134.t1
MALAEQAGRGVAKRPRGRPRKNRLQVGATTTASALSTPSSLRNISNEIDTPEQSDPEAGRQTAATAKRSRLANTENRNNSVTSPQLPSGGNFPIGDEVGLSITPVVPPPDVTFEQGNPLQHHGNGLATGMGQLAFQGFHNRLENLAVHMHELKTLVQGLIWSSSEAAKKIDRIVELQETRNIEANQMGCRDPSRVAGVLVKMEKVKAIHLLVLSASRSPSGYLVSANNLEFYAPIARALLDPSMRLLATFGDEAENERFKESIIQHLAGNHLPSLFAKEVRKKVIDKFTQCVPCDENGHHPRYNKNEFPNVSLETPLFGAEYRIADGDPYGQKSYRDLLESISISFFATGGLKSIHASKDPLESMTENMLAFVEFLVLQTVVGQRLNLGRKMTSRENADLYAKLRADTLSRISLKHVGASAARSRPTNNQLLYKAHFRWKHYTAELEPGTDLPVGTEACASVTSAFLQILATLHNVEACRTSKPRNILSILSTNTRRTKVVELSTGTHRVADELRRHSLSDGMGGHYSTNLDRNRYGSDNNYLFTVTKYNLDALGLCPCLVDIEIVDTRNGNEANIVSAGPDACRCDSAERAQLADNAFLAGTAQDAGERKRKLPQKMKRSASHQNVANSGSELFDALLMAATGEGVPDTKSQGEAPVNDDEKPMLRRNSVSMIVENPVLAQTGAGDSLLVNMNSPSDQGDTEHVGEDQDQHVTSQLARFHKQSSAVNLARLGGAHPTQAEARRLATENRQLREERHKLELSLEEHKSSLKQAEKNAEEAKAAARKAADIADSLRKAAEKSGIVLDEEIVKSSKYLPTSEQEIELLKTELAEIKAELQTVKLDPKNLANLVDMKKNMMFPYAMLPMFGMPPLNPFGGMPNSSQPLPNMFKSMQKVASMPAMHGIMSPPADVKTQPEEE